MILLSLGANLPSHAGPPAETLRAALSLFPDHGMRVAGVSHFYRTVPVPVSDQPDFVNAVARVESELAPETILEALLGIEKKFGRVRGEKNAARTLDLDLLDAHGMVFETGSLHLPHPRLHERAFVLYPLQDVAPDWTHPRLGKKVADMIAALPHGQGMSRL